MSFKAPANDPSGMKRVKVIGIGNPLMGDDGAGIAAIERLEQMDLPAGVEAVDGGTGGLTLLHLIEDADRVIFLDAVAMNASPGSVRRFDRQTLLTSREKAGGLSLHETGLVEVLMLARQLMAALPDITLIGIEPQSVEPRLGLSDIVARGVATMIEKLLEDLSS